MNQNPEVVETIGSQTGRCEEEMRRGQRKERDVRKIR